MTPLLRVQRARRRLGTVLILGSLMRGVTIGGAIMLALAVASRLAGELPAAVSAWFPPLALLAGIGAAGLYLWRGRAVRSLTSVALWIEERQPALAFALVTAVEPQWNGGVLPAGLAAAAESADVEGLTSRAASRALGRGGLALVVVVVPLLLLGRSPGDTGRPRPDSAAAASRLVPLAVRVASPPYSRLATRQLAEPASIEALPGSLLTFSGNGDAASILLQSGADTVRPLPQGRAWSAVLRMPASPAVLTLRDRQFVRLVVLEPRVDSVPEIQLRLPMHDTTWQAPPRGRLQLSARASDDFGLASGYFEVLVSAGGGESFETRSGALALQTLNNARSAELIATVLLDTLKLVPGSVLSIRAVALDGNDVGGPGRGVSETRTLRVADPSDSSTFEAQPPDPIDETRLSQRMLNLKTDTLIGTRRRLPQAQFAGRSTDYADLQMGIRQRVLEVVSLVEDADEEGSYPTEQSRLLRSAADDMLNARRELLAARPDSAMPYMRHALKLLDQVRTSHRYYLRGRRRAELVDIEHVRGQGKESGRPGSLLPRAAVANHDAELAARIETAAALYPESPGAALDTLTYVRVAALTTDPAVAVELKSALESLRRGVALDAALAPVRRLLAAGGTPLAGPPEWGGGMVP